MVLEHQSDHPSQWAAIGSIALRIPMKTAIDSDGKRPPIPIQSGHFFSGPVWPA
jgi:hypothetical protein